MLTCYNTEVNKDIVESNLSRIGSQIFRCLPCREEGEDWIKPLETLALEVSGLSSLFPDNAEIFKLLIKLQGLINEGEDVEFMFYRRTIFECCSLVSKIKENL